MGQIDLDTEQVFIYGFGISGRWAADIIKNVVGFIDTDCKKWGKSHSGISVFGPDILDNKDTGKITVIVAVVDIFDVLPLLKRKGVKNWRALSEFIDTKNLMINKTGESDEFLSYSLNTVKKCQNESLLEETFFVRSIDLVITEKCTLKCKDCANLMQFFDNPQTMDSTSVLDDITMLSERCDGFNEVRVIGGEPFINKQIYVILEGLTKIEKISSIVVYTNGMIPPKIEHLELLKHMKIFFSVTDYGDLGRNTHKTIDFLKANNIKFRVHPPENWTDSGKIGNYNRSVDQMKEIFSKCCGKNLYTVVNGKFYRCPFAANADSLKAIPENKDNYVRVKAQTKDLKKYAYDVDFIPACNFCPGRSFDAPEIIAAVQTKKPLEYKKFGQEDKSIEFVS